jgi:hypothetical protein
LFTGSGDPQTPLYPSVSGAFREKDSSIHGLPKIPAQVIGYKYAQQIFELLEGKMKVNSSWAGIMNVTYTYGGKLNDGKLVEINHLVLLEI